MTTQDQVLGERAGLSGTGTRRPRVGRATLRAIYIIWYRDLIRFWRDRARLIASFAQPLLYLLVFGTGLSTAMGAGSIVAKKHLLALAEVPEIVVAGLCRRDAGELQMLADRFRVPRRYTDYRDLLSDPGIDAVLVATGPAAQPEIVRAAAAAGKHVFAFLA